MYERPLCGGHFWQVKDRFWPPCCQMSQPLRCPILRVPNGSGDHLRCQVAAQKIYDMFFVGGRIIRK